MFLLLRLDSFAMYLYRENDSEQGPVITIGDRKMTHFEIRRNKDNHNGTPDDSTKKNDERLDDTLNDDDTNKNTKPEKEIVGYWEDGLAIYADGTREERDEGNQSSDHRQLSEVELDREGLWEEKFGSHTDTK